jgi:hypothetical protein
VTRTWAILAEALRQIVFSDDAVVHPAVTDPTRRVWDAGHPEALEDTLTLLGHEADALVELVGQVPTGADWARGASVAGGTTVTALQVLQDAVDTGAEGLKDCEYVLRAVRGRP